MSLIVDRFSLWMTAQLDYCGAVAAVGFRSAGGPNFPIVCPHHAERTGICSPMSPTLSLVPCHPGRHFAFPIMLAFLA